MMGSWKYLFFFYNNCATPRPLIGRELWYCNFFLLLLRASLQKHPFLLALRRWGTLRTEATFSRYELVCEKYFSHASSYPENVASAHRVPLGKKSEEKRMFSQASCARDFPRN